MPRYTKNFQNERDITDDTLSVMRKYLKDIIAAHGAAALAAQYNITKSTLLNFANSPIRVTPVLYDAEPCIPSANTVRIVSVIIDDHILFA